MSGKIIASRLEGTKLTVETEDGVEEYDSQFLVAALLVFVARGSGRIMPEESAQMIELIEEHFHLQGSQTLELLTRAISELIDKPELPRLLVDLAPTLSQAEKEDIAFMGLKVIAADGHRHFAELEQFNRAMEALEISPDIVHRAFERYFAETMQGS
ncbi:MAG: TerB family tellurite resistance protein [Gammaproteobacteria bacterium]|nr:TerB family tellurite resistance protein [Gammaproteobacteria bacterium]